MTKRHKILHVFPSFEVGGAQRRVVSLINAKSNRYTHSVFAMDGCYDALKLIRDIDAAPVLPEAIQKMGMMQTASACRKLLKEFSPDLMITYNWGSVEWVLANRFFKLCPMIQIQDGFGVEEQDKQIMRRRLMRCFAYRGCDAVVVPSKGLEHMARDSWNIRESRLHYIPNGINIDRFICPPNRDLMDKHGLTSEDRIIGTVAALRPEKNLGRLIESFAQIAEVFKNTKLVIVGDGMGRPALQMLTDRIGLSNRVVFAGALDRPEELLAAFEIFALSSNTEQMPLSVIEAMACGLPIVSTNVGDIRQMVCGANQDFIIGNGARELTRSLSAMLGRPDNAKRIGAANQQKAKNEYALSAMIGRYDTLFADLIKAS